MLYLVSSIGRSGTRYLSQLFASCTSIPSFHLAEPYCHGPVYRAINQGETPEDLELKIARITEIERASGAYFESTPVFIRGLAPTLLARGFQIKVIHLLRDPLEVARSYANRESYPSHPNRPWRLPLNLPHALLTAPSELTPFQENLCDWLENELRFHALETRFVTTVDWHFSDYDHPERMARSFAALGVEFNQALLEQHTAARDLDRNPNQKPTEISPEDLAQARDLVNILLDRGFDPTPFSRPCYASLPFFQTFLPAAS